MTKNNDILVIGAGLAGLTAAWQAAGRGKNVRLISKGWGATHWHAGCVDVLGYWPVGSDTAVASPAQAIPTLLQDNPNHPYALVGQEQLAAALTALKNLCAAADYQLEGSLTKNWLLPSGVGTHRPTCLAPVTMTAGDLTSREPMLIVGFKQLVDFYPNLVADNLTQTGIPAEHVTLDLPTLAQRHNTTAVNLAEMMEQDAFRDEVATAVRPHLGSAARVGFPAVLGLAQATAVHRDFQKRLGLPVFEIPGLPPSVAGIRLHRILKEAIEKKGGRVFAGVEAMGCETENGRITAVISETASRPRHHRYQHYVLATGGILGGGITTNHRAEVREVIFDLPLNVPENRLAWFRRDFMDDRGHPIYRTGIVVNEQFQPANGDGRARYQNLFAAGTTLAHCEAIRERSFDGIALATGYVVGQLVGN